ncbi:DUF4339 domain-containing protein [Flavobacterium algicola]|uniref:DUF4339 domain-containing protein n=1 Tax=Flavobacterium algicola TaxID=556529 RepID=UPI001EFDD418|nr:DUF4339 domain-containing protein [Flavobacterium algicola]MCG9793593.1 GYF domain-containing protein [Flavobacterium algicola]
MNSYFLHDGIESSGPFTIEELKFKNIKATTPVWCEGMLDWKNASEVVELRSLLVSSPPPIKKSVPVTTTVFEPIPTAEPIVEIVTPEKKNKILGLNKSVFIFILFFGILIVGSFILSKYQDMRREETELKNEQTEKNNVQYRLQQKEIEEQKIQMEIQEKIDLERQLKERKEALTAKINANNSLLATAHNNFEIAKNKLSEAANFQFFRSDGERAEEIALEQQQVSYWKKEVENITNETDRLKLELDNLH